MVFPWNPGTLVPPLGKKKRKQDNSKPEFDILTNSARRIGSMFEGAGPAPSTRTGDDVSLRSLAERFKKSSEAAPQPTGGGSSPASFGGAAPSSFGAPTSPVGNVTGPSRQGPTDLDLLSQDRARAEDLVALQFNPLAQELERQLKAIGQNRDIEVDTQEGFGRTGDKTLDRIYNELQGNLRQNEKRTGEIFQGANEAIGEGFQQGNEALVQSLQAANTGLVQEAAQLGIQDALESPLTEINEQLERQLTGNNQASQEAVANATKLGAEIQALAVRDVSNASKEEAQERASLARTVSRNIGEISLLAARDIGNVNSQLKDLATQRGIATREAFREVTEARTAQERQVRLDALAEHIQLNTLMLQQQQLGLQMDESLFNRQLAEREFGLNERKLGLDERRVALDERLGKAEIAKAVSAGSEGASGGRYKGIEGVSNWAQDHGLGAEFFSDFQTRLTDAMRRSGEITGGNLENVFLTQLKTEGLTPDEENLYAMALAIYDNKFSSFED